MIERFGVSLSRHTFGPRDRARAGHLWRLLQDVAIEGSSRRGWPPRRYAEVEGSFVVRRMTVVHAREVVFGEALDAATWVSTFRRGTLSDRQIRLAVDGRPVVGATQRWVYVALPELKPARAPERLLADFAPDAPEGERDVALPAWEAADGAGAPAGFTTTFDTWHGAMDPLGHANHPAYVDWADEALCRWLAALGHDPQASVPVAEELEFRSGVVAPEPVTVALTAIGVAGGASAAATSPAESRPAGRRPPHPTAPPTPLLPGWEEGGSVVLRAELAGGDGRCCAEGVLIRRRA